MATKKAKSKDGATRSAPQKKSAGRARAKAKRTASPAARRAGTARSRAIGRVRAGVARAAQAVAKVSPLRGMNVGQWIKKKLSGWQADVTHELVDLVRRAVPGVVVTIKWGQPVFEHDGPFAYVKPAKAHVTFGFWRGTELPDPKGLLEGEGDRMKHVKLTGPGAFARATLEEFVKHAVRLNEQKGDPTKR